MLAGLISKGSTVAACHAITDWFPPPPPPPPPQFQQQSNELAALRRTVAKCCHDPWRSTGHSIALQLQLALAQPSCRLEPPTMKKRPRPRRNPRFDMVPVHAARRGSPPACSGPSAASIIAERDRITAALARLRHGTRRSGTAALSPSAARSRKRPRVGSVSHAGAEAVGPHCGAGNACALPQAAGKARPLPTTATNAHHRSWWEPLRLVAGWLRAGDIAVACCVCRDWLACLHTRNVWAAALASELATSGVQSAHSTLLATSSASSGSARDKLRSQVAAVVHRGRWCRRLQVLSAVNGWHGPSPDQARNAQLPERRLVPAAACCGGGRSCSEGSSGSGSGGSGSGGCGSGRGGSGGSVCATAGVGRLFDADLDAYASTHAWEFGVGDAAGDGIVTSVAATLPSITVGSNRGTVQVWRLVPRHEGSGGLTPMLQRIVHNAHRGGVTASFASDPAWVFTGGGGGTVKCWTTRPPRTASKPAASAVFAGPSLRRGRCGC